jgi:hypothetical protein
VNKQRLYAEEVAAERKRVSMRTLKRAAPKFASMNLDAMSMRIIAAKEWCEVGAYGTNVASSPGGALMRCC